MERLKKRSRNSEYLVRERGKIRLDGDKKVKTILKLTVVSQIKKENEDKERMLTK